MAGRIVSVILMIGGRAGGGGSFGGGGGASFESLLLDATASFVVADESFDLSLHWEKTTTEATATVKAASFLRIEDVYVCGKIRHLSLGFVQPYEKMVVYSQTFLNAPLRSFAAQEQPICTASHLSLNRKD